MARIQKVGMSVMERAKNISDVSRLAGVSRTTVSHYLNKRYETMSEVTRRKIERVIAESGYHPSNLARSLKSKQSRTVGVIVHNLRGQVSFLFVKGTCEQLEKYGYNAMIFVSDESPEKERECIERCLENCLDGIILVPCGRDFDYYTSVHARIPIVLSRRYSSQWPYDNVYFDEGGAVEKMVVHLRTSGFTKIAFFTDMKDSDSLSVKVIRRRAFITSCGGDQEAGAVVYDNLLSTEDSVRAVEDFCARFPDEQKAVMAVNVPVLVHTLTALRRLHVSIPSRMGLCGYSAWDWNELVEPGITGIRQPLDILGHTAVDLMMLRIQDRNAPPRGICHELDIVIRDSTRLK